MDGVLAQLVERLVRNEKVRSSSLLGSTNPETFGVESLKHEIRRRRKAILPRVPRGFDRLFHSLLRH